MDRGRTCMCVWMEVHTLIISPVVRINNSTNHTSIPLHWSSHWWDMLEWQILVVEGITNGRC